VGGRTECQQPHESQAIPESQGALDRQGDSCQSCTDQDLHDHDPPAFGFQQIDQRAPQWLYHPGKIQTTGIKGDIGIRHAHAFE